MTNKSINHWHPLDVRVRMGMDHVADALDRRDVVRGTIFEGLPFFEWYMGDHVFAHHEICDFFDISGRYLTALSHCLGIMKDSGLNLRKYEGAAASLARYLLGRIDARGHFFLKPGDFGFPFSRQTHFAARREGTEKTWTATYMLNATNDGHMSMSLEGLVRFWLLTGDGEVKEGIDRLIRGRFLDPKGAAVISGKAFILPGMLTPLIAYYRVTGDAETRRYIEAVAEHFITQRYLDLFPDGKHGHGDGVGHLHSRLGAIVGFARYAELIGNREYLEAAEELFRVNTSYGTEFGWMPERHLFAGRKLVDKMWLVQRASGHELWKFTRPRPGWDTCEICVTADAIDGAMFFAKAGFEGWWDIGERYLNHLCASQVTDPSCLVERKTKAPADSVGAVFDGARELARGGFMSWNTPYWMLTDKTAVRMLPDGRESLKHSRLNYWGVACCHGWGIRTLALVWEHATSRIRNTLCVNLPISKETDYVQVRSHLPGRGQIEIRPKILADVQARIPDWVEHQEVKVEVAGRTVPRVEFKTPFSDFIKVGRAKPGETIVVSHPLRQERKRYRIEFHDVAYEAHWLGNTVVDMKLIGEEPKEGYESFAKGTGRLYPLLGIPERDA